MITVVAVNKLSAVIGGWGYMSRVCMAELG